RQWLGGSFAQRARPQGRDRRHRSAPLRHFLIDRARPARWPACAQSRRRCGGPDADRDVPGFCVAGGLGPADRCRGLRCRDRSHAGWADERRARQAAQARDLTMDWHGLLAGIVTGLAGGFTSGLLGVSPGGGLVVFSVLLLGAEQHVAQGISLIAQIPPTSLAGIRRYWETGYRSPLRWLILLAIGFLV